MSRFEDVDAVVVEIFLLHWSSKCFGIAYLEDYPKSKIYALTFLNLAIRQDDVQSTIWIN